MKKTILLLGALILAPVAFGATAPERNARVAGGNHVKLVASAQTPAQWTAQRPQVRELRPKVRGTYD